MLQAPIVLWALVAALPADSPGSPPRPGFPAVDGYAATSASGEWRFLVDPSTRWGRAARHRLERCGELVWEREDRWTLRDGVVTDAGLVAGWHRAERGGWRLLVRSPSGSGVVDHFVPYAPPGARYGIDPFGVDVDERCGTVTFRIWAAFGEGRFTFDLRSGALVDQREAPRRSDEPVPTQPLAAEEIDLAPLATIDLEGPEPGCTVLVASDGRILARDRGHLWVFDDRGRLLFRVDGALVPWSVPLAQVDAQGNVQFSSFGWDATGAQDTLEHVHVLGTDGSVLEERQTVLAAVLFRSQSQPNSSRRWATGTGALYLLDGGDVVRTWPRYPDGTWFQPGPMGVARDGSLALLGQAWSAEHPTLWVFDADGEPRGSLALPGFPRKVWLPGTPYERDELDTTDVLAFDGDIVVLTTSGALLLVDVVAGRVWRAPAPVGGQGSFCHPAFSPTGRELLVPRRDPPGVLVFRAP